MISHSEFIEVKNYGVPHEELVCKFRSFANAYCKELQKIAKEYRIDFIDIASMLNYSNDCQILVSSSEQGVRFFYESFYANGTQRIIESLFESITNLNDEIQRVRAACETRRAMRSLRENEETQHKIEIINKTINELKEEKSRLLARGMPIQHDTTK